MVKRGPKPRSNGVMWSPELAYGVGLMASDGCLSPDGRHLLFSSKDFEQVCNVKKIFAVRASIRVIERIRNAKSYYYYRLQWGDVYLYAFLVRLGITPNKSLTIGCLEIPDEHFFDFLRGSHDGDGCFYSYFDPRWKSSYMFYLCFTSASKEHLTWIQNTLGRLLNIQGSLAVTAQFGKRNPFYQLKYAKADTLILLKKLYSSEQVLTLSRKRLKIETALRIVGLSLSTL